MEKEWKELVAIFQDYMKLHSHLHKFQEIPEQYIDNVKKIYSQLIFQIKFIEKELPEHILQQLTEMKNVILKIRLDYAMAKVI
jgi:hypothetical protein